MQSFLRKSIIFFNLPFRFTVLIVNLPFLFDFVQVSKHDLVKVFIIPYH